MENKEPSSVAQEQISEPPPSETADEQASIEQTVEEVAATAVVTAGEPNSGVATVLQKPAKKKMSDKTKKLIHNLVISPIMVLVASFIRAVCVHSFMLSFEFASGGITGIGMMIEFVTGFSTGYTNIIINAPLIILAFIFLSKGYAIKSTAAIVLSSVGMVLMKELGFPQYTPADPNAQPVLAAIACGALSGVGVAIMIKAGGSNGGTDIIAAFIQRKYVAAGITWFIMGLDAVVIFISFFVINQGLTPVLMSLVELFCSALMGDVILTGFKSALKYEIITDNPEALSRELIEKLGHSVTKMDAVGMYAHSKQALLICVIRKRQLAEFNKILKKYPNTFAYVSNTSEVVGRFSR